MFGMIDECFHPAGTMFIGEIIIFILILIIGF